MSFDRFDFEQDIMRCWGVVDELHLLYTMVTDGRITPDEMSNMLLGLKEIYELRFNNLLNEFESGVQERKIN